MPRRLRIEYPGAIYHVMARGNGRQDIVETTATGNTGCKPWNAPDRPPLGTLRLRPHVQPLPPLPSDSRAQSLARHAATPLRLRHLVGTSAPPIRSCVPGAVPRPTHRGRILLLDGEPLPASQPGSCPAGGPSPGLAVVELSRAMRRRIAA